MKNAAKATTLAYVTALAFNSVRFVIYCSPLCDYELPLKETLDLRSSHCLTPHDSSFAVQLPAANLPVVNLLAVPLLEATPPFAISLALQFHLCQVH